MLDINDFGKKQILLMFPAEGQKLSFQNDNILVKDAEENIIHQSTCYRLFAVYIVGHTTITTGLIERARKFGFAIALFSVTFRLYEVIGSKKDSNTLLHRLQYENSSLEVGKRIIQNKIYNQRNLLAQQRQKSNATKDSILHLQKYLDEVPNCSNINDIMGYEGAASKAYFKAHFDNVNWIGRKPRIKPDYVNSLLDIGYTVLFAYIEVLLNIFGFDTYCGVLHRSFYMRKSLVCDIVEPFRVIIDHQIKKSINLGQFKKEDFVCNNSLYQLAWKQSPKYVGIFLKAILEKKDGIFLFIQQYYRSVMRNRAIQDYPFYLWEDKYGDN